MSLTPTQRARRAFPIGPGATRFDTPAQASAALLRAWPDDDDELVGTVYRDARGHGWRLVDPDGPHREYPEGSERVDRFEQRADLQWQTIEITIATDERPGVETFESIGALNKATGQSWGRRLLVAQPPQTHRNPEAPQPKPVTLNDLRRTVEELQADGDYAAPSGGPHDFHSCRCHGVEVNPLSSAYDALRLEALRRAERSRYPMFYVSAHVKLEGPNVDAFVAKLRDSWAGFTCPRVDWLPLQRELWTALVVEQLTTQKHDPWQPGEARRHVDQALDELARTLDFIVGAVNGWERGDR